MNKSNFFNIIRATSTIEVEGLGSVNCRELSAAAVAMLQKDQENEMNVLSAVLLGGVVDDSGKPMFAPADRSKILDMPIKPLQTISEEIMRLSGFDADLESDEESPNE